MPQESPKPSGYLTFTLHAHLPYVVNHGTWPHGMEWLHEAAAETYLPLLRVLGRLERDTIRFQCNLDLSPVLLEQLAHPVFRAEFPRYLSRKMLAAQEDEAFFRQSGEAHYADLARFWNAYFREALDDFNALGGDLIAGFRHFNDTGLINVITCCATHAYLPLVGTDESVRAQLRTAVATYVRHFGRPPTGVWLPECGYRPAGFWSYPVPNSDGSQTPGFDRIGVEQALAESGLDFFFVDTHLIEESHAAHSPYSTPAASQSGSPGTSNAALSVPDGAQERDVYQPYLVAGPYRAESTPIAVFPRDPRTGVQVWSGELGYPGDGNYLDFHKKRWPGGHRYWSVTGAHVDMEAKQPYHPEQAFDRAREHAAHFVGLVREALTADPHPDAPPILCAPFDAELFGHWWFEGPAWLEQVARNLAGAEAGVRLISCREYLDLAPPAESVAMREGSWGAEGGDQVWLNPETSWTYAYIYPAERYVRDVATAGHWRESPQAFALVQQLCRELLLLESSDWQFLITTGAARDYAEARFLTHSDQFNELRATWETLQATGSITAEQQARLTEITIRDGIFPELDPGFWIAGAHATPASRSSIPPPSEPPAGESSAVFTSNADRR